MRRRLLGTVTIPLGTSVSDLLDITPFADVPENACLGVIYRVAGGAVTGNIEVAAAVSGISASVLRIDGNVIARVISAAGTSGAVVITKFPFTHIGVASSAAEGAARTFEIWQLRGN